EFFGEVLYNLAQAEMKLGRRVQACTVARRLYSRFPQHELVQSWGVDLASAKIGDTRLGCEVKLSDTGTRIRTLQLSGQAEKARNEALELKSKLKGSELNELDLIYSRFLVNEGMIDEALALLMRQYPQQKQNFDYLMQVAFAAARGGE